MRDGCNLYTVLLTLGLIACAIPAAAKAVPDGVTLAQDTPQAATSEQHRTRAETLIAHGRYREAVGEFDAILQASPDDAKAYNDRGLARWRSLEPQPPPAKDDDGFALLQRESCREGRTDCEEVASALADLARAIDLSSGPERAVALANRAPIYAARGDVRRALADYDAAVDLAPRQESYRLARAQVRQQAGDTRGARADLDKALQLQPHDGPALLQRARLRRFLGDLDGTRADLDEALRHPLSAVPPSWFSDASTLRRAVALPGEPVLGNETADLKIAEAAPFRDPAGRNAVSVKLDPDAARRFGIFTSTHIGSVTEIVVDGRVIAAPRIISAITGGSLTISGAFTPKQAADLAALLNAPGATMTVRAVE